MQSLRCGLLAVVASLGLCGCAAETVDVPAADPIEDLQPEGIWANSLSSNAMTQNALISNPLANGDMVKFALNTASYADSTPYPNLKNQLRHGPTRQMMNYLVGCALSPGQVVSYTHGAIDATWEGELGLCPSWNTGPASATCQELVSACLLARVNAVGVTVDLSMRGQAPTGTSLNAGATVTTITHNDGGGTINSFEECLTPTPGAARNCGYKANYVGKCTPSKPVSVGAGSPPPGACGAGLLGSASGDTVLRVCEGIRGCNHAAALPSGESEGSCGTPNPSVTFSCPSSGNFSVMSGPQTGVGLEAAYPGAASAFAMSYPATEKAVFPWQEGAFYGNVWAAEGLHGSIADYQNWVDSFGVFHPAASIPSGSGPVFMKMFACSGTLWTLEKAYMKDRLCAGSTENCAAKPMGACSTSMTLPCPPTNLCSTIHGVAGSGDYDNCMGGTTWGNPITVYLNQRDDILQDPNPDAATSGTPEAPLTPLCP